jgi:site-specific recombinase XerD
VDVAEIGTDVLRAYVAGMYASALSPFIVASQVRAYKRLFNWLEAEEQIEHNPAHGLRHPSRGGKRPRVSTGLTSWLFSTRPRAAAGPTNPDVFRHGFAHAYLMDGGYLGTLCDLMDHPP